MSLRERTQRWTAASRTRFAAKQLIDMVPALWLGPRGASRSWSQHGEDEELVRRLAGHVERGYYVDVGASHPTKLSNTYRLHCLGMRGVTIEPNPVLCGLHRRFRPGDVQLCCGVGDEASVATFHELGYHALSTFSDDVLAGRRAEGHSLVRTSDVPVVPLRDLLERHRPPGRDLFALLSVDTEGWDERVLRGGDWERWRPLLVLVEESDPASGERVREFLGDRGYRLDRRFGCNLLFEASRPPE